MVRWPTAGLPNAVPEDPTILQAFYPTGRSPGTGLDSPGGQGGYGSSPTQRGLNIVSIITTPEFSLFVMIVWAGIGQCSAQSLPRKSGQ